jgi:hypothetical protein
VAGRAEAHHRVALTAGVLREPVPLAVDEVDVRVGGAGPTERGERVASTGLEGQGEQALGALGEGDAAGLADPAVALGAEARVEGRDARLGLRVEARGDRGVGRPPRRRRRC